ncbi:MAG TPA: hypothetical protein VF246_01050 [Acidimicrobiia bacterium]
MSRQRVALLGALVALVMALAPAAWAGEVKGPPGPGGATGGETPIAGFFGGTGAASICSFSGLNDEISEEEPTQVQSYGRFMVAIMHGAEVDVKTAKAILGEAPGDSCNPNRAPFGNPKKQP